jgi:DNA-nicking Smr family endonuclease
VILPLFKADADRAPLTEAERQLWRMAVEGIKPLTGRSLVSTSAVPAASHSDDALWPPDAAIALTQTKIAPALPSLPLRRAAMGTGEPEPSLHRMPPLALTPSGLPFHHHDVQGFDKRMERRLRRGQASIDSRLDLHGMTQAQAHGALNSFLLRAQMQGHRLVLVITGKGGRDGEVGGALRHNLPRWLGMAPLSGLAMAIRQASPRHGGTGAFYILLRRLRG